MSDIKKEVQSTSAVVPPSDIKPKLEAFSGQFPPIVPPPVSGATGVLPTTGPGVAAAVLGAAAATAAAASTIAAANAPNASLEVKAGLQSVTPVQIKSEPKDDVSAGLNPIDNATLPLVQGMAANQQQVRFIFD